MKRSHRGFFYGNTTELIPLDGVTLTDTVYSQGRVDWHFHEDNYFTFLLTGGMCEGNKKEVYECVAGDLLFHNWQDAHYNLGSGRFTRGFHVELSGHWYERLDIRASLTEGSIRLSDPLVKTLMYDLFREAKLSGTGGQPGVDALLTQIFGVLGKIRESRDSAKPAWVARVREMLRDDRSEGSLINRREWSLVDIAREVNIHPVHLSREFPKHFHTNLGNYLRMIRIQRAMTLLPDATRSLTDIAFECGFADQSHFIRSFKAQFEVPPLAYRRLLCTR
ncbi:MAG TPA: helix-turn-helix transcriptional regulator [Puia sp.]|jgi:AraC-like DNA-binding protein|nr:helix-turn-helix transcriptional regulator [Puia sp.]